MRNMVHAVRRRDNQQQQQILRLASTTTFLFDLFFAELQRANDQTNQKPKGCSKRAAQSWEDLTNEKFETEADLGSCGKWRRAALCAIPRPEYGTWSYTEFSRRRTIYGNREGFRERQQNRKKHVAGELEIERGGGWSNSGKD